MFIQQLFEGEIKRVIAIYPGRFQPFHLGHKEVFETLQAKFGMDNVFIGTSNKTDAVKSPFNFSDKLQLMTAAGVNNHHVIEVSSPYMPDDYIRAIGFNPAETVLIFAVGAPDLKRLEVDAHYTALTPTGRPSKIPDGKSVGDPKPFKTFKSLQDCETADQHQYVLIVNEREKKVTVNGKDFDASHGTQVRALWNEVRNDPKASAQVLQQLYGRATPEIAHIFNKIPDANAVPAPAPAAAPKLKAVKQPPPAKDLSEFAPPGSGDDGNDGFSDETLKRLAAQWWQGDEDPRVEQTLAAAGWEIGQDEGYDNGGVFVVQAGDINGNSYISWPAEELESLAEDAAGVGVIANKKQKNDPRYSMSMTKDVGPGELKKNMKKLHLEGNRGYAHGFASPTAPSLGRRGREDDEYHVPDPAPSTWYIRANGKIIKDKMGTPFQYRDKEAARKAAQTMMSKPFNAGKKFVLTVNPTDEQPVAENTGPVTHRIGLTVTDPNHPMVSKRKETYQKTVRVKGDDREKAINGAIAHYRRKGYKVHDHHYIGTVDAEPMSEVTGDEKFDKSMRQMTGKITPADAAEMFPTQEFEPYNLDPSRVPNEEKYKAKLFPLAYQYWTDGDNADELRALGWEPDYGDDYVMVVLSGIGHDGHIQYDKYDFDAEGEDVSEGGKGISKDAETKFHSKLDALVHDTFGKRKSEKGMAEGATGAKPGWMLKQDPALAKKVKDSKRGHEELKKWAGKPVPKDDKQVDEGTIITKDDLVDIYIKGVGKNKMPIQKKIGAQIPNSKVNSFIATVAEKYGLNPKAFVYGPSNPVAEGKHFKTAYGWAGGSKPGGGTYKHPDQIKADREAKKKSKEQEQEKNKQPDVGVAEGAELKKVKRQYNQAAKDANADQVGAGKKIDTTKNSLRQKDVDNKKQGVAEVSQQTLQSYRKKASAQKRAADDVVSGDADDETWKKNVSLSAKRRQGIDAANKRLGVAEGKKPDSYHIVNKDGKPATLASYADKASAEKDRDAKHPGAEVRQVGPRGKVKGVSEGGLGLDHKRNRFKSLHVDENAEELNIGDPVIISGQGIEFEGKTGDIDSFGDMKRFVVVNLYNHGRHSFHSSDVSYNDYADKEDDLDEDLYQYDKEDPYNSEFAPRAGMGRMTLRGWKQQMIKRTAELAQQMATAGQDIDKSAIWDHVHAKLKSMNMDPIAQEIEQAQAELEKIRQRGGVRSRAFNK